MIAHVAEASEASGRVLLWLNQGPLLGSESLDAPVRVAAAYGSELETVVFEAPDLSDIGELPIRFVTMRGKASGNMPNQNRMISKVLNNLTERQRREIDLSAARSGVVVTHATAHGDVIDRLAEMCLERGPWNIIAVSRSSASDLGPVLNSIFANVSGATGVVVSGNGDRAMRADVAVVLEDAERMPSMVRAAERLVMAGGRIHVFVAVETATQFLELDTHMRLLTAGAPHIVHAKSSATFGVSGAFDEALCKMHPSFIIARYGGTLLPDARALSRLLTLSPAPCLLVR